MHAPTHHIPGDAILFGAFSGVGILDLLRELGRRGPSWEAVPSLLLAIVGVIGAVRALMSDWDKRRDAAQERRHKEELHRIEVDRQRKALGLEVLPSRN